MDDCSVEYSFYACIRPDSTVCYGIVKKCSIHGITQYPDITENLFEIISFVSLLNDNRVECEQFECVCEDYLNRSMARGMGYFEADRATYDTSDYSVSKLRGKAVPTASFAQMNA